MPFDGIRYLLHTDSIWLLTSGLAVILATIVGIVGRALWEETASIEERRTTRCHAFADRRQSRSVHACTRRLSSMRRAGRLEAVHILRQLNDPTAVPALIKALARYNRDVPFVIAVIQTLSQLGDTRAVPALRPFTTDRHYDLMRVARQATQAIEAKSVLLRPSGEPGTAYMALLRAAQPDAPSETITLLRAGMGPER
jgi:HEAT repeat protein